MKSIGKRRISDQTSAMRFRRSLLATACGLALAGGVSAQTTTYLFTPLAVSTQALTYPGFAHSLPSNQINTGLGSGTMDPLDLTVFFSGGTGTPVTITNNTVTANGNGNTNTTTGTVSLGTVSAQTGQLAGGSTASSVTLKATVNDVDGTATLTNQGASIVTVSGNKITANDSLNLSTSTLSGATPSGFTSAQDGAGGVTYAGTTLNVTSGGGINIGTNQVTQNASQRAGSAAVVQDSNLLIDISQGPTQTFPISLSNNSMDANFGVNTSTNTIDITSATGGFGSAATITNAQLNVETRNGTPAASTALVTGSDINADTRYGAGGTTIISSALSVNQNSVGASSTGNSAGNSITMESGVDVTGTGTVPTNTISSAAATSLNATVQSDLTLLNAQSNQGTRLLSDTQDVVIRVLSDTVSSTGSISLNRNSVTSSATGNVAVNDITSAGGDGTNFTATAAAANLQTVSPPNNGQLIRAQNVGSDVSVNVGADGVDLNGVISVNRNTLSATAIANAAATNVSVDATNITTPIASSGSSSNLTTRASSAVDGVSATNVQASYGVGFNVRAELNGGTVAINAEDQSLAGTGPVNLVDATLSANRNSLTADAVGSTATTGVSLTGTNVTATAGVASTQYGENNIQGRVLDSGVSITALGVDNSTLTANRNTIAASALANDATNSLTVSGDTTVTTGIAAFTNTATTTLATGGGALSVTNGQTFNGTTQARNLTDTPFVQISVGDAASTIDSSDLTVNRNTASATSVVNQASNSLAISSTDLAVSTGVAGQVGSITNLQVNNATGEEARVGRNGPLETPMIGITYDGSITGTTGDSNLTVSNNLVSALAIGNTVGNAMAVTADTFSATAAATGVISAGGATSSVTSPFSLLNRQIDNATTRDATVQNTVVGIDDRGNANLVQDANLTASNNTLSAEARNNVALNTTDLTGFSSFTGGASTLNQQTSAAATTSTIDNSRVRIQAAGADVIDTNLTATANKLQALAVGNTSGNGMAVSSSNELVGNATIAVGVGGSNLTAGVLTTNSDFGVANMQTQTGTGITASSEANVRIVVGNGTMDGGTATINKNQVNAIAQANTAVSALTLDAPNVTASAAVASSQSSTAPVSATTTTQAGQDATFEITAASADGTPLTVVGNSVLAAGGQNDATNVVGVTGTTITGRGFNGVSSAGVSPNALGDVSVLNVQSATAGVTSLAVPGLIGTNVDSITGTSAVVNRNTVTAQSLVNTATNTATIGSDTTSALSATGALTNVQSASGSSSATVGDVGGISVTNVGIFGTDTTLDTTAASVNKNELTAAVGLNSATNTLSAASTVISNPSTNPTFTVLNAQTSSGTMVALALPGTIGVLGNGLAASITDGSVSVSGNTVTAQTKANTATNALNLAAESTLTATALVNSTQTNSATGSATVGSAQTPAQIGVFGYVDLTGTTSLPISVQGNSVAAIAGGNSANNSLTATAESTIAGSAGTTFQVLNNQTNSGAMTVLATNMQIGVGTATTYNNVTASVNNNSVMAIGYGNSAINTTTLSALPGTNNASSSLTSNTQLNTAAITTTVSNVTVGIGGGAQGNGGSAVISGNTITSSSSGNVAVNTLVAK